MCHFISCCVTRCNTFLGFFAAFGAAFLLTWTQGVEAGELIGADRPDFQTTLALWLDGDEAQTLPAFAELARDNNLAAQVMLGLIDKRGALQGPLVARMSRSDRIAQLRAPGGMSGQNWITHAAAQSAFAKAMTDLWHNRGGVEIAERLAGAGELRACREALLAVSARKGALAPEITRRGWYPEELRHLSYPKRAEAMTDLHPGDPQRRAAGEQPAPSDLRDWLQVSPLGAPLREVCATHCPDSMDACPEALYVGLGSYPALLMLGSPVAELVQDAEFARSARGHQAIARQIMLRHMMRGRDLLRAKLEQIDACTAQWLASEFARYAPVRSGTTGH